MGQTVRARRKVQHIRTVYPTTPHGGQERQGRTFLRAARRAEVEAMVDVWVKVQTRIRWPSYSPPIRGHPTDDPMRGFRPGSAFYLIGILRHTSASASQVSRVVAHHHGQAKAHSGPLQAVHGASVAATTSTSISICDICITKTLTQDHVEKTLPSTGAREPLLGPRA